MDFVTLAWKNLWRNRRRTLITLLAISLGLMLAQTLHNLAMGSYGQMVENGVRSGSGHFALYAADYRQQRDEKLCFREPVLPNSIRNHPSMEQILARVHLSGLAQSSHDSRAVAVMGIDMAAEVTVNPVLRQLPEDQWLRPDHPRDALLGKRLVEELKLRIGHKLVLTLQDDAGNLVSELLRLRGVIDSRIKQVDSSLIMIDRRVAARISGRPQQIHELSFVLKSADDMPQIRPQLHNALPLSDRLELVSWQEAMPNLADAIRLDYASQNVMLLIIMLIITIGIVNTLLMSVMERIHEFGILLATGASALRLGQLVLCEAILLGTTAAVIGSLFGSLTTWYLVDVGIDLRDFISENMEFGGVVFDPIIRASWEPLWMMESAGYIVLLSLLAALYPAIKAARLTPVEAMRHH